MNLETEVRDYTRQVKELYLPYLAERMGVEIETLNEVIVNLWDEFPNPIFKDNLLYLDHRDRPEYYEICDTKYSRGKAIHHKFLNRYVRQNQKKDQHISVYRHDIKWVKNAKSTGSVSCYDTEVMADWIYLELDRDTLDDAIKDSIKIARNFPYPQAMKFWYSGNKSIHIAVDARLFGNPIGIQSNVCSRGKLYYNLAHKIAGDIRHNNRIVDPWFEDNQDLFKLYYESTGIVPQAKDLQKVKQYFENIDPNLYRVNSLIRQPWSIHEKGKKKKIPYTHEIKKEFDFDTNISYIKPYLLPWTFECYEAKFEQEIIYEPLKVNNNKIISVFTELKGFDPSRANRKGWVNDIYSPFYEDSNPSVAVNIITGQYKDFGNPEDSFSLYELYSRIKGISFKKAKQILEVKG